MRRLGLTARTAHRERTIKGALPGWSASSRTITTWRLGRRDVTAVVMDELGGGFDAILGVDAITSRGNGAVSLDGVDAFHVCVLEETGVDLVKVADDAYEVSEAVGADVPEGFVRVTRKGFPDGAMFDTRYNGKTVWDYDKHRSLLLGLLYKQAFDNDDPNCPRARVNRNLAAVTLWVRPGTKPHEIPWVNKEFGRQDWVRSYLRRWVPENVEKGVIEILPISAGNPAERPPDHACIMLHVVGSAAKPRVVLNGRPLSHIFDMSRYAVEDERSIPLQQEEAAGPGVAIHSTLDFKSGFLQIPLDTTRGLRVCTVVNGVLIRFCALGMGFG
ncbi:hypothetical protein B484DRAFT_441067, partial [Ochromonadaceae sp. CCMP2298]